MELAGWFVSPPLEVDAEDLQAAGARLVDEELALIASALGVTDRLARYVRVLLINDGGYLIDNYFNPSRPDQTVKELCAPTQADPALKFSRGTFYQRRSDLSEALDEATVAIALLGVVRGTFRGPVVWHLCEFESRTATSGKVRLYALALASGDMQIPVLVDLAPKPAEPSRSILFGTQRGS